MDTLLGREEKTSDDKVMVNYPDVSFLCCELVVAGEASVRNDQLSIEDFVRLSIGM
jgi:hypothetical protein